MRVGGFEGQERDFYVRQLRDWKGSVDVGSMSRRDMADYGRLCGWTLARAHARTGAVIDRTFRAAERVEQAILDKRDMQFLYADGDDYVFMDTVTYDQLNVPPSALGDAAQYLVPQATANLAMHDGQIVRVDIPG